MERRTILSPCRLYRYTLWREWDEILSSDAGYLMVIGLNPSTADETQDDPTIRKCVGFAKRWGFSALCMTNLFAFRATDPAVMKAEKYPVGGENNRWLQECAMGAQCVLAAWGAHGSHNGRAAEVTAILSGYGNPLYCLKKNKDGSPMHPLYVPYECPRTSLTEPSLV